MNIVEWLQLIEPLLPLIGGCSCAILHSHKVSHLVRRPLARLEPRVFCRANAAFPAISARIVNARQL
jgi:hypothetical protein